MVLPLTGNCLVLDSTWFKGLVSSILLYSSSHRVLLLFHLLIVISFPIILLHIFLNIQSPTVYYFLSVITLDAAIPRTASDNLPFLDMIECVPFSRLSIPISG